MSKRQLSPQVARLCCVSECISNVNVQIGSSNCWIVCRQSTLSAPRVLRFVACVVVWLHPLRVQLDANRAASATLEEVKFSYPTRKAAVIFNRLRCLSVMFNCFGTFTLCSLELPAGKTVAVAGPSGSGKSTIVQLLERFYDVGEPKTHHHSNAVDFQILDACAWTARMCSRYPCAACAHKSVWFSKYARMRVLMTVACAGTFVVLSFHQGQHSLRSAERH